jgi:hypothetical protein
MTPANQAIEEIKEIVKKYDLAAMVAVSSPDEIAYLKAISPSWSCAWSNQFQAVEWPSESKPN